MAGNTSPEMEEIIAQSEAKGFDTDKALNTKGFLEFLAAHPKSDTFDMGDVGEVQKRFETFEVKGRVGKELKELYSSHIEKEMGIKLDAGDQTSIDKHIEKMAIENPEKILEIQDSLKMFKELPVEIGKLEEQLAQLGKVGELATKLDVLRNDKINLETTKESLGFVGKSKLTLKTLVCYAKAVPMLFEVLPKIKFSDAYAEDVLKRQSEINRQWGAREAVKDKFGKLDKEQTGKILTEVESEIVSIEKTLASINNIEKLKILSQDVFGDLRKELLGGVSDIAELTVAIQSKVNAQFQEMTRTGTIKSMDQAQARFESLRTVAETTETGVNPLGAIDADALQEALDIAMERMASQQILETVLRANMGTNALTKLEKSLEPFLEREKIGSKEGDEARELISKTLENVAKNLGTTNEDKAKKLMIARILIKIKMKS